MEPAFCISGDSCHGPSGLQVAPSDGPEGEGGRVAGALPPSLSLSNNSIEKIERWNEPTGQHKRTAHAVRLNVERLVEIAGVERVGFLTLTVPDAYPPPVRELLARFNSFLTNKLKQRFPMGLRVVERGEKYGRPHLHLVVDCGCDIRTGVDFEALKAGDYRTASKALRNLWRWLRIVAPRYGFGRTELMPVYSNKEGIAFYVGGYIKKGICNRVEADKGCRMAATWGDWGGRKHTARITWGTPGAFGYRSKLGQLAKDVGATDASELDRIMGGIAGASWRYKCREQIRELQPEGEFPCRTEAHALALGVPRGDLQGVEFPAVVTRAGRMRDRQLTWEDVKRKPLRLPPRDSREALTAEDLFKRARMIEAGIRANRAFLVEQGVYLAPNVVDGSGPDCPF